MLFDMQNEKYFFIIAKKFEHNHDYEQVTMHYWNTNTFL